MATFVKFGIADQPSVYINPEQVTAIEPVPVQADGPGVTGSTGVFLAGGKQYTFDVAPDEVARRLAGDAAKPEANPEANPDAKPRDAAPPDAKRK